MSQTVFVVYGQDSDAHAELGKFLNFVGLQQITFEEVANRLTGSPFVADVVFQGISEAEAVIVLFTPDELSVCYDSRTGAYRGDSSDHARWQARPNVIFEAGVALGGTQRGGTIIAVIGADIRSFSDVSGMHFVRLDQAAGKRNLYQRLRNRLPSMPELPTGWDDSPESGDFVSCVRRRWTAFDEVWNLSDVLAKETIFDDEPTTVLDVLRTVVRRQTKVQWNDKKTPWQFCEAIEKYYHKTVADLVYWTLFVEGFFKPENDEQFFSGAGNTWRQGAPFAVFAERGLRLLERLRAAT